MEGANVWCLDWLTMDPGEHARDSRGVQWVCTEEKGFWSSPGPKAELTARLNQHGSYRPPGYKQSRTISLKGRAFARDWEVLRQAEADVLGLLSDPQTPGDLTCHSELGALTCQVYLDDEILCTPYANLTEPAVEFSLQLVAPDPRKYAVETQVMSTGLAQDAGDGLDFAQVGTFPDDQDGLFFGFGDTDGLFFGTNISGFMTLTNRGTAPTFPIYTLHGPLTSPALTAGSYTIRYNANLAAGEFVVIDPLAPSVLLGGTAVRRHLVNPAQFQGFAVPAADPDGDPGALSVGLTHSGPVTDAGWVDAEFRSAWF